MIPTLSISALPPGHTFNDRLKVRRWTQQESVPTKENFAKWGAAFRNDFSKVPEEWLVATSSPLYAMCSLAWDYIYTILDICAQQRLPEYKKLSRQVRVLSDAYLKFRACVVNGKLESRETEIGLAIEDACTEDISRLCNAFDLHLNRIRSPKCRRPLCIAALQAVAVLRSIELYSQRIDRMLVERWHVSSPLIPGSFVQGEVFDVKTLIPKFLTKEEIDATRQDCEHTAKIFLQCLSDMEDYIFEKETKETASRILRQQQSN